MNELHYPILGSDQLLTIESGVLQHMFNYRQLEEANSEAGGQLFGRFEGTRIVISRATGPNATDFRTRFRFLPNRRTEKKEIEQMYTESLHFVGDWHTHPQRIPLPSNEDINSIRDIFSRSKHQLAGMVMIIIGLADPPDGLFVSVCNAETCHQLRVQD